MTTSSPRVRGRSRRSRAVPRRLVSRGRHKGPTPPIDPLDVAILNALRSDGRASLRRVARLVGASVTTVSTRVRALERLGVLQGFVPLVSVQGLAAIGRSPHCVALYVRPARATRETVERVARHVAAEPAVCYLFQMTGTHELMALASTRSEKETDTLLRSIESLPEVSGVRTIPILRVHKERPNHPVGSPLATAPDAIGPELGA